MTQAKSASQDKTLEDLFYDTLKDIYFAERQILKALPKMMKATENKELRAAFEKHREETEGQVDRLQQVFEIVGKRVGDQPRRPFLQPVGMLPEPRQHGARSAHRRWSRW